jgi:hypothetical protein
MQAKARTLASGDYFLVFLCSSAGVIVSVQITSPVTLSPVS